MIFAPHAADGANTEATVMNLGGSPQRRLRVLVVEDNLDSVHSMAMLIQAMGHDVEFAINGFVALDLARAFRPDVVLLDIGLPDFKGDQVARKLKRQPGLATGGS